MRFWSIWLTLFDCFVFWIAFWKSFWEGLFYKYYTAKNKNSQTCGERNDGEQRENRLEGLDRLSVSMWSRGMLKRWEI